MTVSVKLAQDIEQRLNRLAESTGRSKSYHVRELIEHGLEDLEDYYLAEAAIERIRIGQETCIDSRDVRVQLGLDGPAVVNT